MPSTPAYSLPYPTLTDAPNGPAQLQALAEAAEAAILGVSDNIPFGSDEITDWQTYSPTVHGYGAGDWANRIGLWRRIAPKTVAFAVQLQKDTTAGSGSLPFQFDLPTACTRAVRLTFPMNASTTTGGSYQIGMGMTFTSGSSGALVDRIVKGAGGTMAGSDVVASLVIAFTGVYPEA